MAWAFFGAITSHGIQSQDFGNGYWKCLETIPGSPGLCSRFGFDPGTDVFRFCCVLLLEK